MNFERERRAVFPPPGVLEVSDRLVPEMFLHHAAGFFGLLRNDDVEDGNAAMKIVIVHAEIRKRLAVCERDASRHVAFIDSERKHFDCFAVFFLACEKRLFRMPQFCYVEEDDDSLGDDTVRVEDGSPVYEDPSLASIPTHDADLFARIDFTLPDGDGQGVLAHGNLGSILLEECPCRFRSVFWKQFTRRKLAAEEDRTCRFVEKTESYIRSPCDDDSCRGMVERGEELLLNADPV